MKRVLIFYSKTGGGHLRAAQALAEEISRRPGYKVILSDGLEKTSWGLQTNPTTIFLLINQYSLPIFNLFYELTDNKYGLVALRKMIKFIWGENYRKIIEQEKPDLIITTHHFMSPSTIAKLNEKVPFNIMVTDLGEPHGIWFDEGAEKIIVPNLMMAKWAKSKFSSSRLKIKPVGYPLKKDFKPSEKSVYSNQILIVGSGLGESWVKKWITQIKKHLPDKKIVIICGHNRLLSKKLSKLRGIKVFGFVDNLHQFLKESDIVISKAGPGLIVEATTLKKPIILTRWVGRQEKGNVDFVISNNIGVYDPKGDKLIFWIRHIYQNYPKYTNSREVIRVDIKKIVDQLLAA